MNSAFFLALRRMRMPIIVLIVLYAVSVVGLTLIPGVDAEGKATPPLSFFHAFYFISYTATTIGFGEVPNAFSDAQRMWVTVSIYLTVVGYSYSFFTLFALLQDKGFQNTLTTNRFSRRVRLLKEPFYLVCGCGETGNLICKTLDRTGRAFVVIEKDELRVQELDLQDFKTDTPALAADASIPDNLLLAGLKHPKCRAVLAVTSDEQGNLAIAIAVRLLNPSISVIAQSRTLSVTANMSSFGTDHIINPFARFSEHLALAITAPERFRLIELVTALPETPLPEIYHPPRGRWILCGYGRFGRLIADQLMPTGIELTIIDPLCNPEETANSIRGYGTEAESLLQAGIGSACGIIAGSDSDVNNLSIAVTAAELNPSLFVVTRQNLHVNSPLFEAYQDDYTMVPSRIVAQECIAILTAPMLAAFIGLLRECNESWSNALVVRLQELCHGLAPVIWGLKLNIQEAQAAYRALMQGRRITLGEILRDGTDRSQPLRAITLLIRREDEMILLPPDGFLLAPGDQLLIASSLAARRNLELTLYRPSDLDYVLTGHEVTGSWVWNWMATRRRAGGQPS
ncbi:MAG: NAD-binding protein [Candidatus Dechloromonas phosphoritropha]